MRAQVGENWLHCFLQFDVSLPFKQRQRSMQRRCFGRKQIEMFSVWWLCQSFLFRKREHVCISKEQCKFHSRYHTEPGSLVSPR